MRPIRDRITRIAAAGALVFALTFVFGSAAAAWDGSSPDPVVVDGGGTLQPLSVDDGGIMLPPQ